MQIVIQSLQDVQNFATTAQNQAYYSSKIASTIKKPDFVLNDKTKAEINDAAANCQFTIDWQI